MIFQYASVRYTPNILRNELVNVGVIARNPMTSSSILSAHSRERANHRSRLRRRHGIDAANLDEVLQWAYATFVAEPATNASPINYQALAPHQTRERCGARSSGDNRSAPRRARQRAVFQEQKRALDFRPRVQEWCIPPNQLAGA